VNRIQRRKILLMLSRKLTSEIIMYIIQAIHMNYQNCNIQEPRPQYNKANYIR